MHLNFVESVKTDKQNSNSEKHKISNSELINCFDNIGYEIYFIYGCYLYSKHCYAAVTFVAI